MIALKKWFKNKLTALMLSFSNVEKNALGQLGETLSTDIDKYQRHTQGQLADSLVHGEVTQEVIDMRWRIYKIIRETEGVKSEIVGYDKDGMPIVKTIKRNLKAGLKKIKLDTYDSYPLEMVIDNSEIVLSGNQAMDNDNISIFDEITKNFNDDGELISVTHGNIDSIEYFATNKTERPITIFRDEAPKFKLETYTKKLNVRKINESERLLEFYVSKYPDEYDRTSRLFLSDLKKAMTEPEKSTTLKINSVNFISYKSIGVNDFLHFEYSIISFDKIIEYNGFYVIKFISKVEINGKDILDEHRVSELDKKYEEKQKK